MKMPQPVRLNHVAIPVTNMARSEAFYTSLGLRAGFRRKDKDIGDQLLQLAGTDGTFVELIRTASAQKPPANQHLGLRVDDIHETYVALLYQGITPLDEPQRGESGVDWFFISDPDGNQVEFTALAKNE